MNGNAFRHNTCHCTVARWSNISDHVSPPVIDHTVLTPRGFLLDTVSKGVHLYSIYNSKHINVIKVCFYIAVSSPLDHSKRFIFKSLYFSPWQTCSFQHQIDFSGKHSAMLQLLHEDCTHISTAVYRQVPNYSTEWNGASWRDLKCPCFETAAKVIRNRLQLLERVRQVSTVSFEQQWQWHAWEF